MKRVLISIVLTVFMIFNANANYWNPDPYQYENNMTVVGVVTIDGVEQTSEDLELGAFCNGEVRGSVIAQYVPTFNRCLFFMMIYGVSGDNITFSLYNHSTAEELDVTSLNDITFSPNAMIGTVVEPYLFSFHDNSVHITIGINPDSGGTATGAGSYDENDTCTIVVTPNIGYDFVNITENGGVVSTEPIYTFVVTENRNLMINFVLQSFDVNLSVNQDIGGTVSGGGTFDYGTEITVTAAPEENYSFISWKENDSVVCTTPEYTFVVTTDRDLVATFSIDYYTITTEAIPDEGGNIAGAGNYMPGTTCNLIANPVKGWKFDEWIENGNVVGTDEVLSFLVNENHHVIGIFSLVDYEINVASDPEEGGTVSGGGTFHFEDEVTVTAIPNTHYFFDNWTIGDSVVSLDQEYTFTVTESVDLTAHFHFFDNLNENGEESVQIYPNPASEKLYIIGCNGNEQVASIINMAGETIFTKKITSEFEIIELSHINEGVYILAIGNKRIKFVIR